ncbi:autotransporter-associated beta strand repeat-containing protein [Vibrio sp. 10N]|uniref:autotransporter-associated beta strand repeat-containing protein n=1 Tax=Vibrio sp. 10N TaxID=3058938 RepID=UPI0030C6799F
MKIHTNKNLLAIIIGSVFTASLMGCKSSESNTVLKPNAPSGIGYELHVPVPETNYPLPMVSNGQNNSDSAVQFNIDHNPLTTLLSGMNDIWTAGVDGWQNNANGDGPESFAHQEILDADVWRHNIQYVVDVTNNRTLEQAIESYSDDRRSKNYSVIDAFGPLTQSYLDGSEAYVDIDVPKVTDITENYHFFAHHNDGGDYTGNETSPLGDVVRLVRDLRNSSASTNPSKYIYSTPRPWRMDDDGDVVYLGSGSHSCVQLNGEIEQRIYDNYQSSVDVLPGVFCAGRHHGSDPLTDKGENRRKDGGYPSGHTNAGYLAAMGYAYAFPERFAEFITRGSQMGENRILTGMHSPVDVIGARIHFQAVSAYALSQQNVYNNAQRAYENTHEYFTDLAHADGYSSLYDYAHRKVAPENEVGYVDGEHAIVYVGDNNRYSNNDENKKLYRERMTYGFEQDLSKAGQKSIVPKGAERLLETRLPYLSDAQRRAVLYTTSIDSGYPILDQSNGWGRIDLVTAADGYGAFEGDVKVYMDAEKGRFNANDSWRNDIAGEGKLRKSGSGILTLTGENTYAGGTIIEQGVLAAGSPTAFGTGDVYINGGTLKVDSDIQLNLANNLTISSGDLAIEASKDASLEIASLAYLDSASLTLTFGENAPQPGERFTILTANKIHGEFNSIESDNNVELSVDYGASAITVTVL